MKPMAIAANPAAIVSTLAGNCDAHYRGHDISDEAQVGAFSQPGCLADSLRM